MARKFLTSIDLNQNELIKAVIQNATTDPASGRAGQLYYNTSNDVLKVYSGGASAWMAVGSTEQIGDAINEILEAGSGIYLNYNDPADTLTISNTGVLSLAGTANEIDVSASAGNITISLPSTIYADLNGNAASATYAVNSGSASYATTAGTANAVAANSVALGTDTTGNYVATASAGTGIDVTGSGSEGSSLTITNTGVISLTGTANEVTVSASAGAITIGLPDNVTVGGNLTVDGDLTVSGSTTYLNTATLAVEDNKVLLNSNVSGSPSIDAGIEVERGDLPNVELFWDESEGKWTANNGSASYAISLAGHTHSTSDITNFSEAVEDAVDSLVIDTATVGFVYTDNGSSAGTLEANVLLAGAASATFLTTSGGLSVDKSTLESALIADSFIKKYSETFSGSTQFNVDHNLGSRDVTVQVYDVTTYETVEVDVERPTVNRVVVKISEVYANSLRVVVTG